MVKENTTLDVAGKKFAALQQFIEENKINGLQAVEVEGESKIFQTKLLITGHPLPLFIVLNPSVYNFIQVHLVTIAPEQSEKCLEALNALNINFSMLKYGLSKGGNITLTCSIPTGTEKFDPAMVIALIDQVQEHLTANYDALMQKILAE